MRYLIANPQPSYLRLGKAGEPCFHPQVPEISPGQWLQVNTGEGGGKTLLTTGAPLAYADKWIRKPGKYHGYALHSLPLWGMSTKSVQVSQTRNWEEVVTIEDHLQDAGFGSWLYEALAGSPELISRVKIMALSPKICGMVGNQDVLNELGGLTCS